MVEQFYCYPLVRARKETPALFGCPPVKDSSHHQQLEELSNAYHGR